MFDYVGNYTIFAEQGRKVWRKLQNVWMKWQGSCGKGALSVYSNKAVFSILVREWTNWTVEIDLVVSCGERVLHRLPLKFCAFHAFLRRVSLGTWDQTFALFLFPFRNPFNKLFIKLVLCRMKMNSQLQL